MQATKMETPKHYDEYIFKIIAVIFAASITGLVSKEPLATKIKNLCAGVMGGGIVIILSMGYTTQPWWVTPVCVLVSASTSSFWPEMIAAVTAIFKAAGKLYLHKFTTKKDDPI